MPYCETSATDVIKESPGQLDGFLPTLAETRQRLYDQSPAHVRCYEIDPETRNARRTYENWVGSCFKAYVATERIDRAVAWLNEATNDQDQFDRAIQQSLRSTIPWQTRWELVSAVADPDTRRSHAMYYLTELAGRALEESADLDYHPTPYNLEQWDQEDIDRARQIYAAAPQLTGRSEKWENLAKAFESIASDASQPEEQAYILQYLVLGWRTADPLQKIRWWRQEGCQKYGEAESMATYGFFKTAFQVSAAVECPEHAKELLEATVAVIGTLLDTEYRKEMTLSAGRILAKRGL